MTYETFAAEWDSHEEISCHTSGSTGKPKTITIPKTEMLKSARRTADFFRLDDKSLLYSCISPDYIGGKMMFVRQRLTGCRLLWETPSNRPLTEYKGDAITLLAVVPSQMSFILDHIREIPPVENILIGGSPIPSSLRKRIAECGVNAYESYGMTETASHIALRRIEADQGPFKTLGNITVESCADSALRINMPGWRSLITNDSAQVLSAHQFRILGRLDNIIISGGIKINPEALEEKLSEYLDFPFFITSTPDDKWGERVILIAEGKESLRQQIEEACSHIPDKFKRPKDILIMHDIPRTANGKFIRKTVD